MPNLPSRFHVILALYYGSKADLLHVHLSLQVILQAADEWTEHLDQEYTLPVLPNRHILVLLLNYPSILFVLSQKNSQNPTDQVF